MASKKGAYTIDSAKPARTLILLRARREKNIIQEKAAVCLGDFKGSYGIE